MNRNPTILFLAALPVAGCGKQGIEYTHYVPLIFDGNNLVEQNDLKTKARLDRVEHVLTYYKINYERQNDPAIEFSAPMDADFMWNMTTKAEDQKWLREHPGRNGT